MEIRQLKYFLQVAETLNFTQSAVRLAITQPAVSQHIRLLESELDTKLFLRENKALRLTDEGEIAVKYAKRTRICAATSTTPSIVCAA